MDLERYQVEFTVKGPLFAESWPLRDLTGILKNFQLLVDKSFAITYSIKPQEVRNRLTIDARSFQRSSFTSILDLVMATIQLTAFSAVSALSPKDAWLLIKDTYTFLKAFYQLRNTGTDAKVVIEKENNGVIVDDNHGLIVINNNVNLLAERAETDFRALAKPVDGYRISAISAYDTSKDGFAFTPDDRSLFNPNTKVDKNIVKALAHIYQFNVLNRMGKLNVIQSDDIPVKRYTFTVHEKGNFAPFVYAMIGKPVTIHALKEVEISHTGNERISKLIVYTLE